MSSTESSSASSPAEPPGPEPGEAAGVYRGPEYRAATGAGKAPAPAFEPLAHPDPYAPPWLYRVAIWLVRFFVFRLFRTTVEGTDNLPAAPFIVASNHQAWYD